MVGETHIHDIAVAARRLRKTRLLRHQNELATGARTNDLPVFLVNPTRFPELEEAPEPERDFRAKLAELYAQSAAALAPRVDAIKAHLAVLRARLYDLPAFLQRESVKEQITKLAVAAFIAPLALLLTLERPQQPIKNARAVAPEPPRPVFDLDQRLAFAQNLRDRLLSNAITLSMQTATPALVPLPPLAPLPIDRDAGQISAETERSETPTVGGDHETSGMTVPQIAADDDAKWRFPFDSRPYVAGNLPRSPDGSFRAEFAMSDIMGDGSNRASLAENESKNATPAPVLKVKQSKPAKRKKAVAQKRRPQQGNQMTAAAASQPTGAPGEPNLPPPPILFFLGAPPPQSAQPVQAPPSAAPAPAATKVPPPAPPPANKPWAPNSLSDVFKDAY